MSFVPAVAGRTLPPRVTAAVPAEDRTVPMVSRAAAGTICARTDIAARRMTTFRVVPMGFLLRDVKAPILLTFYAFPPVVRITSYNVCYTKLLREFLRFSFLMAGAALADFTIRRDKAVAAELPSVRGNGATGATEKIRNNFV